MWCYKDFNTVEMLPDFFKNIEEFNILTSIYDDELLLLQEKAKETINDFFIETASSEMLDKYCLIFDIDINQNKLENIKSKLAEIPPFSLEYLQQAINRLTGGTCEITVISNYKISIIYTSLYIDMDIETIRNVIYNIIPCNIEVYLSYLFTKYFDYYEYSYEDLMAYGWNSIRYGKFDFRVS